MTNILIDFIKNRAKEIKLPEYDSLVIKDLKDKDIQILAQILELNEKLSKNIKRLSGCEYGGVLQEATKAIGGYYYLDSISDAYFIYRDLNKNEEVVGTWLTPDENWLPFNIKDQKVYTYEAITNEGSLDIGDVVTNFTNSIVALNNRMNIGETNINNLLLACNPVGTVIVGYFLDEDIPGYIDADGGLLDKDEFPNWFAKIGYTQGGWGQYFKNLDLRGEFIRVLDDGRGIDEGRLLGSFQAQQLLKHMHDGATNEGGIHTHKIIEGHVGGTSGGSYTSGDDYTDHIYSWQTTTANGNHGHTLKTYETGFDENRVRNIALRAKIKVV